MMKMMRHSWWLLLTPIYALMTLMAYWAWFDTAPYGKYSEPPFASDYTGLQGQNTFKAGDDLFIVIKFTRFRECPAKWSRFIENNTVHVLPPSIAFRRTNDKRFSMRFTIPQYLTPGPYIYKASAVVKCNPLRSYTHNMPPVPFNIVGSLK